MNDTAQVNQAAYMGGWESYPFTVQAGKNAATLWLTGNAAASLADFRDNRWRAFSCGRSLIYQAEQQAFNDGFSTALAEHIAGVRHG